MLILFVIIKQMSILANVTAVSRMVSMTHFPRSYTLMAASQLPSQGGKNRVTFTLITKYSILKEVEAKDTEDLILSQIQRDLI
jgi:hypothetical protein